MAGATALDLHPSLEPSGSPAPAPSPAPKVSAPLTPSQIAIVKSTAPLLKERGVEITSLFYNNMLSAHPELHDIFSHTNQSTGAQPRALASSVLAYATYVDDLGKLQGAVERIAHKHVSLTVQPEQYAIVGKHLIEAVATVLGSDIVTPDVASAWVAAYGALADIFIGVEKSMYDSNAKEGWTGLRRFKISRKIPESSEITSFYLVPEDGQPLPLFKPGQYVSLHMHIPELGHRQPRQYSLSEAPGQAYYRISVKREPGNESGVAGLISNMLHDQYNEGDVVELTHPQGEFFVDPEDTSEGPVVLISAGVGITPMVSILNSAVTKKSARPISWIHAARSSEVQAFGKHVREVCEKNPTVKATVFRETVREDEIPGVDFQFSGIIDLEKVDREKGLYLGNKEAQYYLCGPTPFMRAMRDWLSRAGVDGGRINIELFGTGDIE